MSVALAVFQWSVSSIWWLFTTHVQSPEISRHRNSESQTCKYFTLLRFHVPVGLIYELGVGNYKGNGVTCCVFVKFESLLCCVWIKC